MCSGMLIGLSLRFGKLVRDRLCHGDCMIVSEISRERRMGHSCSSTKDGLVMEIDRGMARRMVHILMNQCKNFYI
jgi:hypothetical protein